MNAERAIAAFDLGTDVELTPIRNRNNDVFEVRLPRATVTAGGDAFPAGTRLALRIHRKRYRTPTQIRSELELLRGLESRLPPWIRVPRPVAAAEGRLTVAVGGRTCDLLTWIDGRVLRPTRGLGPQATFALGRALAWLHDAGEEFEPPPWFDAPEWTPAAFFTAASPFRPGDVGASFSNADRALLHDLEARTRAAFDALADAGAPSGIIHADFVLGNCRFLRRRDGWVVGVLDFDDFGRGLFVYDLCPLLGNLADFPGYATRRRAFLAGYRSVRALPVAFERHFPVLMAARHAAACAWVIGLHRNREPGAPPLETHLAIRMQAIRMCLALPY